jgi:cyclopropane-fatty-acyl-phospholipid synthase
MSATESGTAETTVEVLEELLAGYHPRDFAVRLWDGSGLEAETDGAPRFTLVLRHPGALRALLGAPSEVALAEAYLYDDVDIEGDAEALIRLGDHLLIDNRPSVGVRLRHAGRLRALPSDRRPREGRQAARLAGRRSTIARDRAAARYHYDFGNDFFELFLDRWMAYSCAYFEHEDEGLDEAQVRKFDYVCRKLRLRPGERLFDLGCGWGGLVIHAARNYGVEALGVTLSVNQGERARERIREAGLEDRCRVEVRDYREVDQAEGFDKIASIGMFEHVRVDALVPYFEHVHRLLKPGGAFLNHAIHRLHEAPRRGASFMDRYVFPDYEVHPISTALRAAEAAGWEVRDVESLREHYVLTTRHWLKRLEERHDEVVAAADEVAYRVWRLGFAGSAYGFATGRVTLFQTLLAKPRAGDSLLPLQRADWYE